MLVLLCLFIIGGFVLLRYVSQQETQKRHPAYRAFKTRNPRPNGSVSAATQKRLYKLCGRKTANRLVRGIRISNPHQTEQWCWEKAIWDLERDRGRY